MQCRVITRRSLSEEEQRRENAQSRSPHSTHTQSTQQHSTQHSASLSVCTTSLHLRCVSMDKWSCFPFTRGVRGRSSLLSLFSLFFFHFVFQSTKSDCTQRRDAEQWKAAPRKGVKRQKRAHDIDERVKKPFHVYNQHHIECIVQYASHKK